MADLRAHGVRESTTASLTSAMLKHFLRWASGRLDDTSRSKTLTDRGVQALVDERQGPTLIDLSEEWNLTFELLAGC